MNHAKFANVFKRVIDERARQDQLQAQGKFAFTCAEPVGLTPSQKYTVLGEEMGEVARVLLNMNSLATDFTQGKFDLPSDGRNVMLSKKLQEELTQVAAVACAWLESMELDPTEGMQL